MERSQEQNVWHNMLVSPCFINIIHVVTHTIVEMLKFLQMKYLHRMVDWSEDSLSCLMASKYWFLLLPYLLFTDMFKF